ncbi:peptidoglycan endopeptidase [Arthrobacter psychrolactophilus]|uniref:Peptidoglycan endopeptidase n=1 Tax=Arthrobacter psychrolactophilus TaxID=92442 RepID=A0A2V5JHI2_9MICC|nr:C40 family peptidase [Arthrobacter psychrolactophilus]PYI39507.1 peptidoglycan endopeptidase [Arthrobacter psychrolactophilus]
MAVPAVLLAVAKRRALLRIVSSVVGVLVPVLIMAMCGGLALVASATQESTTACLTNASTFANTGSPPEAGAGLSIPSAAGTPIVLTAAQVKVAQAFIGVGKQLSVSDAGLQIAIMVGLQESGLRMLASGSVPESMAFAHDGVGSDHDSLGSAQQRPSVGWGSVAELMNPVYDAQAFFGGTSGPNHGSPRGLLDVPGWQSMAKGDAAQAVQISAFPELYAQWEGEASSIVAALKSGTTMAECSSDPGAIGAPDLPANLDQLRLDIIHYAQEGVGGTYVWGGTAFKAWDCSGYVQWIYAQAGIRLPRTEQWLAGTPTSRPQPGDLVVQNPDGPNHWGHVGIYAGNGMMYSALNPTVGTLLHPVVWNEDAEYFSMAANG